MTTHKRIFWYMLVMVLISALAGCESNNTATPAAISLPPSPTNSPTPPIVQTEIVKLSIQPDTASVPIGEKISLAVDAKGTNLKYKWMASAGTFSNEGTAAIIYTAPSQAGPANITIEVTGLGGTDTRNISLQVFVPTPTPRPTPTIAQTTAAPTSPPATPTVPPPPLREIFPQVGDGKLFVYKSEPTGPVINYQYVSSGDYCVHSGTVGLKLDYSMKEKSYGGWGVLWNAAPAIPFDASGFTHFTFWVRGLKGGETFQIGLRDTNEIEAKIESTDYVLVTTDWTNVAIKLDEAKAKNVNVAKLLNVNLGFNANHGTGAICIDDIAFR